MPGFDGENDLLAFAALVLVVEIQSAIDALVWRGRPRPAKIA